MARPSGDAWLPLGLDADPVPGDPQRITEEAGNLAKVASTLQSQIAVLKRIATGDGNVGKTAEKIRSAASSLAGGGDPGIAEAMDSITGPAKSWSELSQVTDALAAGSGAVKLANVAFYAGNAGAIGGFTAGEVMGDSYDKWKEDVSSDALSTSQATAWRPYPVISCSRDSRQERQ